MGGLERRVVVADAKTRRRQDVGVTVSAAARRPYERAVRAPRRTSSHASWRVRGRNSPRDRMTSRAVYNNRIDRRDARRAHTRRRRRRAVPTTAESKNPSPKPDDDQFYTFRNELIVVIAGIVIASVRIQLIFHVICFF